MNIFIIFRFQRNNNIIINSIFIDEREINLFVIHSTNNGKLLGLLSGVPLSR